MKLKSLTLKNFRTYRNIKIDFQARLSFITGRNAIGKTNILEAISLLSLGKSFRAASDTDMAFDHRDGYFISAEYSRAGSFFRLEYGCDTTGSTTKRKIKLNDKRILARSELIGNLATVIFSPADLQIIEGGPAQRRRFLDMVLSSHDPHYLSELITFNRALKQRNAVLKKIRKNQARVSDLGPWNGNLSRLASGITHRREKFIEEFRDVLIRSLHRISGNRDDLDIQLHLSSEMEGDDFESALEKYLKRDLIMGYTSVGPHRHNLLFTRDKRDITSFGSQGQKRTLALSLRIAQFYYLKNILGIAPLLLIDDVIRELDAHRRAAFAGLLHECGQAIFTTPDLDGLQDFLGGMATETEVFCIEEGGTISPFCKES